MPEKDDKNKLPPIGGKEAEKPVETPKPEPQVIELDGVKYTIEDLQKLVSGQKKAVQQLLPDEVAPAGQMLLAEVQVQTNQLGSTLHLRNVTPAELMFLAAAYSQHSGGRPIRSLVLEETEEQVPVKEHHDEMVVNGVLVPARDVITQMVTKKTGKRKTATRSAVEERNRLYAKYGKLRVQALYPGAIPQLPSTFNEAVRTGLSAELPSGPEPGGALIAEKDLAK